MRSEKSVFFEQIPLDSLFIGQGIDRKVSDNTNDIHLRRASNICSSALSNNAPLHLQSRLNSERQALDYHRYEALAFHDFADIDEIELGQAHFIDAWHVPFA